jgi:nicotinamidase-related amidase
MSRQRRSTTALLLVDFVNPFAFPERRQVLPRALRAARNTARLKARETRKGVPCIYVNDNFGEWTSEFSALVRDCLGMKGSAGEVTRLLRPAQGDLSVLKPRHSGFYETPLKFLLDELGTRRLIITGLTADMCVFATAQDAYIRQYRIWVPSNCVAAVSAHVEKSSLEHMRRAMKADTRAIR